MSLFKLNIYFIVLYKNIQLEYMVNLTRLNNVINAYGKNY